MKRFIILILVPLFISSCVYCKAENQVSQQNTDLMNGNKIKIKVGVNTFTAKLLDNPSAKAFIALLPLTIKMNELNNNEKYADLSKSLPINSSVPAGIQSGDLMMYGSRTLVLFYKGFSTSYSYTKIGKIDHVTELVAALGSGDVTISFELEKE